MKEIEKIALFDMDQTLADYVGQMRSDLERLRSPEEPHTDIFGPDVPHYIEQRMRLVKSQSGWWRNLPRIELGFEIFEIAHDMGFDNQILTKGPKKTSSAWAEKVDWVRFELEEEYAQDFKVHITEDKGLFYGTVLCDDYPDYMDRWLSNRPRGLGIMIENEFNKDYENPNVVVATWDNLDEVKERLQGAYNR
jgi:5'(3')-deoxyribonucleotidase